MKEGIIKGIVTFIVAVSIMFTCSIPIALNYKKQEYMYEYRRNISEYEEREKRDEEQPV